MFSNFFYYAYSVLCCFSLLKTYADYESNPLLRRGIEFCCRQFYILHRKPFILQLFASVAPLLEFTVRALRFHGFNNPSFIDAVITVSLNIECMNCLFYRLALVLVFRRACLHSVFLTCWYLWRGRLQIHWMLWSW